MFWNIQRLGWSFLWQQLVDFGFWRLRRGCQSIFFEEKKEQDARRIYMCVCARTCVWVCEYVHLSLSVTDLFVFEHVCVWKGVREYMCWSRLSCLSASLRLLSASTRHVCVSVKPYVLDMWYWYVSWKLSVFSRLCVCVFVCGGEGEQMWMHMDVCMLWCVCVCD